MWAPILLVAVFTAGAVYEHLKSEDGIVNLASEGANKGEEVGIPKIWMLGMLSFVGYWLVAFSLEAINFYVIPGIGYDAYHTYVDGFWDVRIIATVGFVSAVSLLADLDNTKGSWERTIGALAVVSIVIATISLIRIEMYEGFVGLILEFIIGGQSLIGGIVLIGIYVYSRSNYFEHTGSMKKEEQRA